LHFLRGHAKGQTDGQGPPWSGVKSLDSCEFHYSCGICRALLREGDEK
jgi:hypothetical protein